MGKVSANVSCYPSKAKKTTLTGLPCRIASEGNSPHHIRNFRSLTCSSSTHPPCNKARLPILPILHTCVAVAVNSDRVEGTGR